MTKKKLYILSAVACMAGYVWLFFSWSFGAQGVGTSCLFKRIFHFPCPSCGSTRAVVALMHGQVQESLLLNPNGWLLAALLLLVPLWMLADLLLHRSSYHAFYRAIDRAFARKGFLIVFICLVLINWIWNITKEL